ncbi:ketopantoate reductase [Dunaliella salina]|uniref:Ketopantoate reductase n=1 Tax=Dunaliella salina TaxID=3046 RepID=A0ABQ7HA53_DUNSA|nr:ketopantoate reductase [Dunaliella salina]|eukprot:KAF5843730.1 ketopantoate reductase [Dunaliella salina]
MLRFHVLGVGSVGQLLAHALRRHAFPVTLLARREELVQEFQAAGSLLTCQHGPEQFSTEQADMELVQGNGSNISNLVISTKGNNVVDAVRSVQGRLLPASSIILIQNGMLAVYQELWNEILSGWDASSRPRIIVGTLTHGAYLTSRFHLFHSSYGKGIATGYRKKKASSQND